MPPWWTIMDYPILVGNSGLPPPWWTVMDYPTLAGNSGLPSPWWTVVDCPTLQAVVDYPSLADKFSGAVWEQLVFIMDGESEYELWPIIGSLYILAIFCFSQSAKIWLLQMTSQTTLILELDPCHHWREIKSARLPSLNSIEMKFQEWVLDTG